jgi:acyl carrier protein
LKDARVPVDRSHIEGTIKRLLVADLEADPTMISQADTQTPLLGRGIGLDSIEALRLALGLEKEYAIRIPDADLTVELFGSLGALVDYVHAKILEPEEG